MSHVCHNNETNDFQDNIPANPVDKFQDFHILVFDLTSMNDATETVTIRKKIGEPLRLELYFSSPLEIVTEVIVLDERMSSVAVDKFGVVGKDILRWIKLPLSKLLTVYLCSSIGTLDHFPQILFRNFQLTRLRLSTHSLATR